MSTMTISPAKPKRFSLSVIHNTQIQILVTSEPPSSQEFSDALTLRTALSSPYLADEPHPHHIRTKRQSQSESDEALAANGKSTKLITGAGR